MKINHIPLIVCSFFLSVFFVLEVHAADPRPGWVEGQRSRYPDASYLTGLGFGDDRRSAENSAYAALARVFRSDPQSDEANSESFLQTKSSYQKTKRNTSLRQEPVIRDRLVLAQMKVAEYWLDPLSKIHYILVVLNRDKARRALQKKGLSLEGEAKMWSERAREAEYPLLAAKALYQGLSASRQADAYQAKLRVIAPSHASPLDESAMSADLQNRLNDLLRTHFQVEIALEGPHAVEVETAILESLNQMGLASGPEAQFSVAGAVRFEKTGPKSPVWHFVRWSTRITLTEKESGRVFGSVRSTGREGQLSPEEAEQKSLAALQVEVNKTIKKRVFQYIFGGMEQRGR